ncbi:MAG: methyltransferase domain-containing protein [Deltaproteobacteria bacterium]|nr:MAG: methyltransferase domain-containing protein [Deltaproteobacteria bacterium]
MTTTAPTGPTDVESAVRDRYGAAARQREAALCCPVEYDRSLLEAIPKEVLERDYGCGDPSRHVRSGDTVLDLGSGGGKICFIASQLVGPEGRVIGIDMNDEMLGLARSAAPKLANAIGYTNVEFRRGRIQDLALDLDRLDQWLASNPLKSADGIERLEREMTRLRLETPMIPDESVDIVVSNCVLNLVRPEDKQKLIQEIFRVLKRGGRIAISDILSDEPIPAARQADLELWSGCISGAFEERELFEALEKTGFYGIAIDQWTEEPFAVVDGIVFRSVTVTARKGKEGPCLEAGEAVIYRGPWKQVEDDDGHVLRRGERTAVCAKTFEILTADPYMDDIIRIDPQDVIPEDERQTFDGSRPTRRDPRESKGRDFKQTAPTNDGCSPESCC